MPNFLFFHFCFVLFWLYGLLPFYFYCGQRRLIPREVTAQMLNQRFYKYQNKLNMNSYIDPQIPVVFFSAHASSHTEGAKCAHLNPEFTTKFYFRTPCGRCLLKIISFWKQVGFGVSVVPHVAQNREVLAPTFWSCPRQDKDVTTHELTMKPLKPWPVLSFTCLPFGWLVEHMPLFMSSHKPLSLCVRVCACVWGFLMIFVFRSYMCAKKP